MPNSTNLRIGGALIALLLVTMLAAGCGGGGEEPGSQAEEPETEGITMYSGRIPALIGPAVDLWEEQVDRDVQVRFGDSATLAATLLEEGESTPADAFLSQDAGSLGALAEAGLLEPLPERVLERVPARFRGADGRWVGLTARARILAYDERELERSELPDSPLELTEPEWRGRVGWAPQNASLQAYVTALRTQRGEEVAREWLEGMVANEAVAFPSNVPVRDAIAAGELDVGLINHYYVAQAIAEQGEDYPVAVHFPTEDLGSLVNVSGIGVLAGSDRRDDALAFVEFLLEEEAQRYFATSSKEYPLIDRVEADPELVPLAEVPSQRIDLGSLDDLQGTLELMRETGAL